MKKILYISCITLPASILFFTVMDTVMGSIAGGFSTVKGFPIPYYRDVWSTPWTDFHVELLKYVDIGLIYIVSTVGALVLFNASGKNRK